jgi:hypothetical protein
MISDIEAVAGIPAVQYRSVAVSLKPKRRFKRSEPKQPEQKPKLAIQSTLNPRLPIQKAPSLVCKKRMKRSGRPNPILRRVMAPSQFSEALPQLPKSSLGRRFVDFLKLWQFGTHVIGRGFLPRQRAVPVSR